MRTASIAIIASLLLAGCTPVTTSDYCLIARPITFSGSLDTPETVRQIREHNAAFIQSCGK